MAFKEVQDLSCDVTVALGGINKKTGKANPTKIEGYYLGARTVEDRKKKSGLSYIYAFQTAKGNVGVWGKTDLDRKMSAATVGAMTRVTQAGTVPTPNGDMYKFKVEIDQDNIIEVLAEQAKPQESSSEESFIDEIDTFEETPVDSDEESFDVAPAARAVAPKKAAQTPDAARQAKVQALLNGSRNKTTA